MKEIAVKNGHGGKRAGTCKPRTNLDVKRLDTLLAHKVPQREIARRFGVGIGVIQYHMKTRNK
jgi:hypothetical protein